VAVVEADLKQPVCLCVCLVNVQYVEFVPSGHPLFGASSYTRCSSSALVSVDGPAVIAAGTTGRWNNVAMLVPPTVPSQLAGCAIINVKYLLKVRRSFTLLLSVHIKNLTLPQLIADLILSELR